MRPECELVLSDGQRFEGQLLGAPLISSGELVFSTGMVGYSEAITDPSYFGQILTFTYPLIGNYGIPKVPLGPIYELAPGFESHKPAVAGVIMAIDTAEVYHWSACQSLDSWLRDFGVSGITGIDTRHIVHQIRSKPGLLARIEPKHPSGYRDFKSPISLGPNSFYDPGKHDLMSLVSVPEPLLMGKGLKRVGVVDCGVKWNILRQLKNLGVEVLVVPWDSALEDFDVSAWVLSNGPGDPTRTGPLRAEVQKLLLNTQKPILGICLGHQVLALAAGAHTYRMPFGHRSHNQPVLDLDTGRGYITSQNHGYVVDAQTLGPEWLPWFININDQSIEGIKHRNGLFRSVQFHPEAAGGPRETAWIIESFVKELH